MTVALDLIVPYLDELLATRDTPDYGGAVNGLQLENGGTVTKVAAAVDFSLRTVDGAIAAGANLLVIHHGMFWGGATPIRGAAYQRLRRLIDHDVAVYASHLPLDRHATLGNNVLLARALGLQPAREFARYKTIAVGVSGDADIETAELIDRARTFAAREGGSVVVAGSASPDRRTRRWALCTGAGASSDTVREAIELGADTLIVGEGPHHTAVDADDAGLVVIYAGHYATETLGVRAVAQHVSERFGIPWAFVSAPTGL
ncbi:MAG TPA: Nif3-like dinuclear metal center hexameric protein [Gemmatimonadaceae bacterium]|nr:Nif3-like dinuclear metal center hexameric protein [Gemmatimonadaceae bacterium]